MAKKKAASRRSQKRPDTDSQEPRIELLEPEEMTTGLDPHLQSAIIQNRRGEPLDSAFSHEDENGNVFVDVIARLNSASVNVPGLHITTRINQIVTGTVAVEDIEAVRANADVLSLKRATRLHSELDFSVGEINAGPTQIEAGLPAGTRIPDGSGVIVGIVDYDFDVQHQDFRNADGTTRLISLWDQRGGTNALSPMPYNYGREFSRDAINSALSTQDPYQAMSYRPEAQSHGTHVAGIAAGNGRATSNKGVACKADLIFVNVSHDDVVDEIDDLQNDETQSLGSSKLLLEAIDYIFRKARAIGRQAVVNVSLGTGGGQHDGTTLVEQGLDEFLKEPGRAIVIAAGNSHQMRAHAQGAVSKTTGRVLTWEVPISDNSDNELEIWYPGGSELQIFLETPGGTRLDPVLLGTTRILSTPVAAVGRIVHRANDPNCGDNHIDIVFDKSLFGGNWKIHLTSDSSTPVPFHAWIERDNGLRSQFSQADSVTSHTLGSISCGHETIVVGSYLSGLPDKELSSFSSEGPTRDGRQKPEVSAPGQFLPNMGIRAASSRTQGATRKAGTSMAAPHVAGLIALLMDAAGRELANQEIRGAVIATSRRNPPASNAWHSRYGFGRIDAAQAIASIVPLSAQASTSLALPQSVSHERPENEDVFGNILSAAASQARRSNTRVKIQIEVDPI